MVASLGDRIRFLGYDLESDQVQAGEPLQFTLYWQALNPMNVSYSVFTHLLGPSNEIVGQKDGIPQDGAYPTTLWQPGEVVVDTYSFVVNDNTLAGEYPLEVGMYRADDGTRLPVADENGQPVPQDRLLLGPITVLSGND
jgi:non-ribosomal peptide synthetase component F